MKYNGTDFNEKVVLSMTRKQFQAKGRIGNNFTPDQLGEVYDLITKKNSPNENNSQYAPISAKAGLTSADGEQHGGYGTGIRKGAEGSNDPRDGVQ